MALASAGSAYRGTGADGHGHVPPVSRELRFRTVLSLPPLMPFPSRFRRRAIEGWSEIGFDVAPWRATGNVRVLASTPAASGEVERK